MQIALLKAILLAHCITSIHYSESESELNWMVANGARHSTHRHTYIFRRTQPQTYAKQPFDSFLSFFRLYSFFYLNFAAVFRRFCFSRFLCMPKSYVYTMTRTRFLLLNVLLRCKRTRVSHQTEMEIVTKQRK